MIKIFDRNPFVVLFWDKFKIKDEYYLFDVYFYMHRLHFDCEVLGNEPSGRYYRKEHFKLEGEQIKVKKVKIL